MPELFRAKIRNIGTSLGVIIPMNIIKKEDLKEGSQIDMVVIKKNLKLIEEAFGSAKKVKFKFERDKTNRLDKY